MNRRHRKSEWGCFHWFFLGFFIWALCALLIVLVAAPSGS